MCAFNNARSPFPLHNENTNTVYQYLFNWSKEKVALKRKNKIPAPHTQKKKNYPLRCRKCSKRKLFRHKAHE